MKTTKKKLIIIAAAALVLIAAVVTALCIAASRSGPKYTKAMLEEKTGTKLRLWSSCYYGDRWSDYYVIDDKENEFYPAKFYIYSNRLKAGTAFRKISRNKFDETAIRTKNTVEGYQLNVCDATPHLFIYRNGNLIVELEDYTTGGEMSHEDWEAIREWRASEDGQAARKQRDQIIQRQHELIQETFK